MKSGRGFVCGVLGVIFFAPVFSAAADPNHSLGARLIADVEANQSLWSDYDKKSFSGLLALALPLAEAGSPSAQFIVGELYRSGLGIEKDIEVGVKWLTLAAKQQLPAAYARLSDAYGLGDGVPKDVEKRKELYGCWASSNLSIATYYAAKTERVLLWHRPGEGPVHQYWLEQMRFFGGMQKRSEKSSDKLLAGADDGIKVRSLPIACRPPRPPAYEMHVAKVDSVDGALQLYVDTSGRVGGFRFRSVAVERLRIPIFLAFQKSFQSEDCVLPSVLAGECIEVPFLFRVE
jgi:Sel1 repeat